MENRRTLLFPLGIAGAGVAFTLICNADTRFLQSVFSEISTSVSIQTTAHQDYSRRAGHFTQSDATFPSDLHSLLAGLNKLRVHGYRNQGSVHTTANSFHNTTALNPPFCAFPCSSCERIVGADVETPKFKVIQTITMYLFEY